MRVLVIVALGTVGALAGCMPDIFRAPVRQPNYYSIDAGGARNERYSRINEWSSYGTHGLGAQSAIAAAYEQAQHAPPPANPIEVYNASLPPGVTLANGTVQIAKDAPYDAIGRFEIGYWRDSAPHETEIESDLHRLAQVAAGDTIVVEVQRFDHADDRVQYMTGLVLRKRGVLAELAPHPHARAHLVYTAGAGCPSQDELADEVSAKLGYSPWQPDGAELRTEIARDGGGYRAKLSLGTATPKHLTGATCKAVIDAAVTVIVVELDESAAPAQRFD